MFSTNMVNLSVPKNHENSRSTLWFSQTISKIVNNLHRISDAYCESRLHSNFYLFVEGEYNGHHRGGSHGGTLDHHNHLEGNLDQHHLEGDSRLERDLVGHSSLSRYPEQAIETGFFSRKEMLN